MFHNFSIHQHSKWAPVCVCVCVKGQSRLTSERFVSLQVSPSTLPSGQWQEVNTSNVKRKRKLTDRTKRDLLFNVISCKDSEITVYFHVPIRRVNLAQKFSPSLYWLLLTMTGENWFIDALKVSSSWATPFSRWTIVCFKFSTTQHRNCCPFQFASLFPSFPPSFLHEHTWHYA